MHGSGRIGELDGLRGVSIALVLLFHYFVQHIETRPGSLGSYAQKYLSLSWAGVDVFFVLSGFLLGGILLDQRGASNLFRVFYLRRALRIMPPYFLFLAFFALADAVVPPATYPRMAWLLDEPLPFWSYALYVQNFFMAAEARFGPHFGAMSWSLAVEEQFYLLFPLLIFLVPRHRLWWILTGFVLAAPAMRVAMHIWVPGGEIGAFVLLPTRWDSLFLGALAALALRQDASRRLIAARAVTLRRMLALAGAGVALLPIVGITQFSLGMAILGHILIAVAVALLLVLISEGHLAGAARLLRFRPLRFLGRISYTVYLMHQAVRGSLVALLLDGNPAIGSVEALMATLLALTVTILLATATWYGFEARLIRLGHTVPYRGTAKPG